MSAFKHASGAYAGLMEVTGKILIDTGKAILLDVGKRREWVPRSRIKVLVHPAGGASSVFMPEWLAREKKFV